MKFTDLKSTINEAGPAVLALPIGLATMEGLALAMGFAGAGALAIHIQNNPSDYNKAMKYMGQSYTDISNWVKGNPESEITDAPRSLTGQLDNYSRQGLNSQNRAIRDQVSASTQAIIDQVDKDADAQAEIIAGWSAAARAETDKQADAYQASKGAAVPGDVSDDGGLGQRPSATIPVPMAQTTAPTALAPPGELDSELVVPDNTDSTRRITQPPELAQPDNTDVKIDIPTALAPDDNDVKIDIPPDTGDDVKIPGTDTTPVRTPPSVLTPPAGTAGIAPPNITIPSGVTGATTGAAALSTVATRTQGRKNGKGRKAIGGVVGGGDTSRASANQMKFNPINIRDPLNLKRYG